MRYETTAHYATEACQNRNYCKPCNSPWQKADLAPAIGRLTARPRPKRDEMIGAYVGVLTNTIGGVRLVPVGQVWAEAPADSFWPKQRGYWVVDDSGQASLYPAHGLHIVGSQTEDVPLFAS